MTSLIGEPGLPLIRELYGKENVSEFDLASRTKKDIKVIRKLLYILYNNNLVSFIRKKDKQKGWYIYYWTLLPEGIKYMYIKKKKELVVSLQEKIESEQKEIFFACPHNCVRLNFDQATDFEFHCPECGELASPDQGKQNIGQFKKEKVEVEQELKELAADAHPKKEKPAVKKSKILQKVPAKKAPVKKTKKKKR